jgi:dTDP-glucose 4,6-dehydratase
MVHISTDEVYGNVPEGYSTEESPLNPSNPYAASKAAADMLARTYANVYRVPLAIVRSGNNYGPFQYPEKLIPLSITNMIAGAKMPMHGNGEHIRSWVHVEDFCDAVDRIAHHTQPFGVFNIAGEHYSNLQIVAAAAEYLKRNPAEHMVMVPDRPSADRRYAPNSFRLERELGWKRTRSLKEALPEIIEWYRTNEAWWQAIKARKEFLDHYEKQSKALWY